MRGKRVLTGVALWLLTVAVAATVTWKVIDAAGRDVLGAEPPPATTSSATPFPDQSTPRTSPTRTTHRPRPTSSSTPHATATPSLPDPLPSGTDEPTPQATRSATAAPTTRAPEPDPTPTGTPAPPPPPKGQVRSWHGAGGTVTVRCTTTEIELQGATPADGYRVEAETEEGAVEVTFKREEPEDEVKVRATCSGGVPRFQVEDERDHG